jgi:hypothetical protein
MTFEALLDQLREFDVLPASDPAIGYRLAMELRDHPDVLTIKLVSGKITFIHRPLWPAVYAIGTAREPWQMRGLSKDARALLRQTDQEKTLMSSGDAVRELEARLLVHAQSVHTERGFHRKQLRTWAAWAESVQLGAVTLTPAESKAQLESVVARLNAQFGARGTLPWQAGTKRR